MHSTGLVSQMNEQSTEVKQQQIQCTALHIWVLYSFDHIRKLTHILQAQRQTTTTDNKQTNKTTVTTNAAVTTTILENDLELTV